VHRSSLPRACPASCSRNAHLDQDQFNAAINYGRLHAIVFGRVWLNLCPLKEHLPWQSGPVPDEETVTSVRQRLDKLNDKMTLEQRQAVANAAVFNMLPTWFFAARSICRLLERDEREREALLSGLTVLTGLLVGGQ
jgi:hypothetical protein